ncbi:unnamed protein product [Closterium sp. Yama58-4]|nr:unnamed protein product [Closterium sp. Yama58-4]
MSDQHVPFMSNEDGSLDPANFISPSLEAWWADLLNVDAGDAAATGDAATSAEANELLELMMLAGETMEGDNVFIRVDGLRLARYGFYEENDSALASSADVFTTWGIQPVSGSFDPLGVTHAANPVVIGDDSAQQTGTARLEVALASARDAAAEQPQCGTHNDNPAAKAGDSTQQTETARSGVELASARDAAAEQQHGSQGVGVGATVDASAKGDAMAKQQHGIPGIAVSDADAVADAKGGATAKQPHRSQGAVAGAAVGGTNGARNGGTGLNITELTEQISRHRGEAGASDTSGNNDGATAVSTTNMQRVSAPRDIGT